MGKTAGRSPLEANRRSSNDTIVQGYLQEIQKYQETCHGFNRQCADSLTKGCPPVLAWAIARGLHAYLAGEEFA